MIMKFLLKTNLAYDLLGNTVVVPVLKAISERILNVVIKSKQSKKNKVKKNRSYSLIPVFLKYLSDTISNQSFLYWSH